MIINVTGTKHIKYTNKKNTLVEGFEVHGVITAPDGDDSNVTGCLTFSAFFSMANLESVPFEGKDYKVVFVNRLFNGTYTAYPHHLEEV